MINVFVIPLVVFVFYISFFYFFSSSPLDKLDSRPANLLPRATTDKREHVERGSLLLCKSALPAYAIPNPCRRPPLSLSPCRVGKLCCLGSKLFTEAIDFPRKPVLTRPVSTTINQTNYIIYIYVCMYIYIYIYVVGKSIAREVDVDVIFLETNQFHR